MYPLTCKAGGPAQPGAGALLVSADERVLRSVQDTIEVLAAQATMALERIAVTEAMTRQDRESYLHAVLANTADVVLIVDDDYRIRHVNSSLTDVLGVEPPAFAKLYDLVEPDDREQVDRTLTRALRSTDVDAITDSWNLRRRDGKLVFVEVNCRDLRRDRMVRGLVITMCDVTERRRHESDAIRDSVRTSSAGRNRRSAQSKYRR